MRSPSQDWMRYRQPRRGVETLRAFFGGHAFDRHAHETLSIGMTDRGVQRFRYRGRQHDSTAGGMIVLHPGETHDGECGADGGFSYRMIYLDAGHGQALSLEAGLGAVPFTSDPLLRDPGLRQAFLESWEALGEAGDSLRQDEALTEVWRVLAQDQAEHRPISEKLTRIRDALADTPEQAWSLDVLAALAGISRFALCRGFRREHGLSPHAYLLTRRLARARQYLAAGMPAAEAAVASGFADQSHLTRNMKRRFGMAPGRFARAAAHPAAAASVQPADDPHQ
jgi:AraC-like DNA-binding protein